MKRRVTDRTPLVRTVRWVAVWIAAGAIYSAGYVHGSLKSGSEITRLTVGMEGLTIALQHQNGGHSRRAER